MTGRERYFRPVSSCKIKNDHAQEICKKEKVSLDVAIKEWYSVVVHLCMLFL